MKGLNMVIHVLDGLKGNISEVKHWLLRIAAIKTVIYSGKNNYRAAKDWHVGKRHKTPIKSGQTVIYERVNVLTTMNREYKGFFSPKNLRYRLLFNT